MNSYFKICLFFFTLVALPVSIASAQSTDEQLAVQYYQNKEYDKAVIYYEKLFNKQYNAVYYNYYLNCLLELKDFKKAEKTVKKLIKQNPVNLSYTVDLGNIYKISGETNKSKEQYENAIKQLSPNEEQILNLARAFVKIKEVEYAIETYLKARRLVRDPSAFQLELAEVYEQKGDLKAMINEHLDAIELNDNFLQNVQNTLQRVMSNNESDVQKSELLKTELLKRVQRDPDKTIFSELLIWMLIQQKEYESALTQAKALDKRKKDEGARVMNLAMTFSATEIYNMAVKAYEYVISKGKNSFYYSNAKIELLNTMYKKITLQKNYTSNELIELEKYYDATLTELGKNKTTIPLLKSFAHLQAFYLHKIPEAIKLLEETITISGITPLQQAECKLELADILLMSGDIWEASLTYSQVEKTFKNDAIGQEAKFRNARISYYTGDFKWAQAQLDVLKGATSKLIANDAMDLSLLIGDNTTIDTNTIPLLLFAQADLLFFQNKDNEATIKLDSIIKLYPNHSLADEILYKKYQIAMKQQKFEDASVLLQSIVNLYSTDILGDDAMFKLAELNEIQFKNTEKAKELYEKILTQYPGSLYVVEARKRYRKLRGDGIN